MPSGELVHLGMDVSMNTIVVGVLRPGEEMPVVDRVFNDEESIRRLIGTLHSGGKRGKQKGAKGSALPWVSVPDEWVSHRPQGSCGCGADLATAHEVGIERSHQVHDLPQVRIRVSQHDVYRVRCECGAEHVGSLPAEVSAAPSSYGVNLKALVVYLLIYQHVPVQRCVQLIADLGGGAGPSDGFVHGMLTRCAAAVREVVTMIKTLIMMAWVVGFDETTLRVGPAGQNKYVLSASTDKATVYHLGGRDLDSFAAAGILPHFAGIAVHDRYRNYFHPRWEHLAGHQACTAHLLRDFTDAAEVYPHEYWPGQAQRALRGLIRAWHTARDNNQPEISEDVCDPLITEFRHAIRVGLAQLPRVPGPRQSTTQRPGRDCWSSAATRNATSCVSASTPGSGPRTTSASVTCDPPRPSKRSPVGSPAKKSPKTDSISAATSTPPANTAPTSSPHYAKPSRATPGNHRFRHPPKHPTPPLT